MRLKNHGHELRRPPQWQPKRINMIEVVREDEGNQQIAIRAQGNILGPGGGLKADHLVDGGQECKLS